MNAPDREMAVLPSGDPVLLIEQLHTVQAGLGPVVDQLTLLHDLPDPGSGVSAPHSDAPLPRPAVYPGDLVLVAEQSLHVGPDNDNVGKINF